MAISNRPRAIETERTRDCSEGRFEGGDGGDGGVRGCSKAKRGMGRCNTYRKGANGVDCQLVDVSGRHDGGWMKKRGIVGRERGRQAKEGWGEN